MFSLANRGRDIVRDMFIVQISEEFSAYDIEVVQWDESGQL